MSAFFEDLFNSIFTPGPTPVLVVATNAAFAALQVLLLILLIGTRSVHFAILSVLCGGLWWAINWFVREVQTLKSQEEQAKAAASSPQTRPGGSSQKEHRMGRVSTRDAADVDVSQSEDTETEAEDTRQGSRQGRRAYGMESMESMESSSSGLMPQAEDARQRRSTGDVSGTDSEWEKLSESEVRH